MSEDSDCPKSDGAVPSLRFGLSHAGCMTETHRGSPSSSPISSVLSSDADVGMAQVSLLDSRQLSDLLEQALSWREAVSSLMVSATNGAVLAYAYREGSPTMKELRSLSTTTTTAYTIASEDVLVFEAQLSRALSVLAPIADHIILAVHGPGRDSTLNNTLKPVSNGVDSGSNGVEVEEGDTSRIQGEEQGTYDQDRVRADLEYVSESLAAVLRQELRGMRWPDDI